MYVYIAGPITKGNQFLNCANAIRVFGELIQKGFYPYCPHLDFLAQMLVPELSVKKHLLPLDRAWVERCDIVLRLPEKSPGSDLEVAHAKKCNIPVYYNTLEEFIKRYG